MVDAAGAIGPIAISETFADDVAVYEVDADDVAGAVDVVGFGARGWSVVAHPAGDVRRAVRLTAAGDADPGHGC